MHTLVVFDTGAIGHPTYIDTILFRIKKMRTVNGTVIVSEIGFRLKPIVNMK